MDFYLRMDQQVDRCLVLWHPLWGCKQIPALARTGSQCVYALLSDQRRGVCIFSEEYEVQHLPTVLCFEAGECLGSVEALGSIPEMCGPRPLAQATTPVLSSSMLCPSLLYQ